MSNVLGAAVACVCIAAVSVLPFIARAPRSVEDMIQSLDEDLLHRLAWFADGPRRDSVEAFEIVEAMGGRLGLFRILRQARLMTGITIEALKPASAPETITEMRRLRWALWRAAFGCLLSPSAEAYKIAMIVAEMASLQETALIEFDSASRVG